jgi:hypothetical protein
MNLESGEGRIYNRKTAQAGDHCLIVGEHRAAIQATGQRRNGLSCPGVAKEDRRPAPALHRTPVKDKQSSLVEQNGNGRAKQPVEQHFSRNTRKAVDDNPAAFFDAHGSEAGMKQVSDSRIRAEMAVSKVRSSRYLDCSPPNGYVRYSLADGDIAQREVGSDDQAKQFIRNCS